MAAENRNVFILARRFPWLLKLMLNQQKSLINKKPDQYMAAIMSNTKHLCDSDRKIMEKKENAEFMLTHMGEAFKKGVKETVDEAKLFCKYWGFDIKEIRVPIEIWHGTEDTLSPIEPIRKLANNVPCSQKNFISGKGHFLTEEKETWKKILLSLNQ
jgi:pimeloyl-ACP methyl ester carboxylesterase